MSTNRSTSSRLLAAALAAGMIFLPAAALAQRAGQGANNPVRNIPVTGSAVDPSTNQTQTFTGTLDIERFEAVGEQLLAVGQINGKFSGGKPVNHQAVAIPVQSISSGPDVGFGGTTGAREQRSAVAPATWDPSQGRTIIRTQAGSCNILTLDLGPLHLDLLGLVVDLNAIHLTITAQQGSGNLLGNLLCAVANLLNPGGGLGGALGQIAGLLSQITNILNGVLAGL